VKVDDSMTDNQYKDGCTIRLSVLSHPDELVTPIIRSLIQKYQGQTTNHTFEAISISFSTLRIVSDSSFVKLILVRPIGSEFFDKMYRHHFCANGAIIFFSKGDTDSFEAARAFYHQFRHINSGPNIPVAFVEIQENPDDLFIEDVIQLENGPHDFYYGIKDNDIERFGKILLSLISHIFDNEITNLLFVR
jgi:hypothetical protein